jgi:hypothetical protein
MATTSDRFWNRVDKQENCWIWTGTQAGDGYGSFYVGGGRVNRVRLYAHRWSYLQAYGSIPEGLEVDHTCRIRLCVKPDHLELVTHAENHRRRRGIKHGPYDVGDTCRHGHPRTPENTGVNSQGNRFCRPCARASEARRRRAKQQRSLT